MAPLYQVFLSHNGADTQEVETLARKLYEEGIKLFFDTWDLVPGERWRNALEEALSQSETCAVFIGRQGLGPWQDEEISYALQKRSHDPSFRVIPVLLPGSKESRGKEFLSFLDNFTWVDFRDGLGDEEAFRRLVAGIQGTRPRPIGGGAPTPTASSKKKRFLRFWLPVGLLVLACLGWRAVRAWRVQHSRVLLLVPGRGIFGRLAAVDDPPPGPDDRTCSLQIQLGEESYRISDLRRQPIYLGDPDRLGSAVARIAGPQWAETVEAWSGRAWTEEEKRILDVLSREQPALVKTARLRDGNVEIKLTCIQAGCEIRAPLGKFTIDGRHDVQPIFLVSSAKDCPSQVP